MSGPTSLNWLGPDFLFITFYIFPMLSDEMLAPTALGWCPTDNSSFKFILGVLSSLNREFHVRKCVVGFFFGGGGGGGCKILQQFYSSFLLYLFSLLIFQFIYSKDYKIVTCHF